ncbi:hypothetical protein G6011_07595 [Alternaria panax]|uniref:LysM domain-containing protein n=1 Tax=Alternaria panax TaxID=48097 RepID=A0AAD4FF30_9PLEO|nr:hypothetical protein G6011_07595 [Alternaria panax]
MYTSSNDSFQACNDIALQYNVATRDLLILTGSEACYVDSEEICGPQDCQLLRVREGQTCESIASAISNAAYPVNGAQLATWNPNILGACDQLVEGQCICVSRPGGSWISLPDDTLPDDSESPVRGDPRSTPTLEIIDHPATPIDPWLLREGIAEDCTRYVLKVAHDAGVEQSRLFELNPILGSSGRYCDTMVWKDYYYCVAMNGEGSPTSTASPSTSVPASATMTTIPKPTNTQAGQPSNCNKWFEAGDGAGCWSIYNDAGIEASQFYEWNPILRATGENCGTQIWPEYSYCVGISASSAPPATTATATDSSPAKPTATQSGLTATCNKFVQARDGDGCWKLANDAGIDLSLFYK